jgi:tetratricopeptide (TPR) repeat protein
VTAPLLLLYTARPEFRAPWPALGHHVHLALNRLTPRQVREMVAQVTLEAVLSDAVVEAVIARTDGVPLFVEELTKTMVEAQQASGTPVGTSSIQEVPATLYDSLMARLDRLGEASKVAQVAAVLGRECSHALLSAVAGMPDAALDSALARLVEAEILYVRGAPPYAAYTFKHALMQDIAYETLLKARRRELHDAAAGALVAQFPSQAEAEPELLARHYEAAGSTVEAVAYYERAGRRAEERSAYEEAITQLRKAIALLGTLPADPARDAREAAVQLALGASLIAVRGFAGGETEGAYRRAESLSEAVGDAAVLLEARMALSNVYVNRGDIERSLQFAEQVLAASEETRDRALILSALMQAGLAKFYQGRFGAALEHFERIIASYDPSLDRAVALRFGSDRATSALGTAGWTLSYLGHLDRALERAREGVALARTLGHPFSIGFARFMEALVHRTRRDAKAQQESAADVIEIGEAQGFPLWRGVGRIYHGLACIWLGEGEAALTEIAEGLRLAASAGNRGGAPGLLWSLADGQYTAGKHAEALATIEGALAMAANTGQHFFDAGLYTLKGKLLLATDCASSSEAETLFHRAVEIARAQEAKTFELRAATSLASLWQGQGKLEQARALLAPVHAWFTEGLDTPDLVEAKALLDALG